MNTQLTVVSCDTIAARAQVRRIVDSFKEIRFEWRGVEAWHEPVSKGEADIAIHEANELPFPMHEDLSIASLIHTSRSLESMWAVVCRQDRADLRGLFHHIDVRNSYGKVWLVGAGPGSADLITIRAQRTLAKANIVYYDDLVDETLLNFCACEHVYVGKRKGCVSHSQDAINKMLYLSAQRGQSVVRLKGGDPSIFGRAGEELDYLRRRWIPVETVPGVTSVSAASASGLFSLTQRRISRSVTFLSGHGIERGLPLSLEKGTLVYYMAASKLKETSLDLVREGISPQMPVVLVRNAGFWDESCVSSTVGRMADLDVLPPALLIVGSITAFARIEKKALFTGIDPDTVRVPEPVVHQQLIELVFPSECTPDRRPSPSYRMVDPRPAPMDLCYFSAVIFCSPLTVEAFKEIYRSYPDHLLCYAFDDATREALIKNEVHPWRIVPCPIQR